jgi:hypothetical protein
MSIGMAIFSTFAIIICFFGFLGQNTAGLRFKYKWERRTIKTKINVFE